MIAAWPDTLPLRPSGRQFSETAQDSRAIFEPDVGPAITRPRITEQIVMQEVVFPPVETALVETLRTFYGTTLKQGSLPFIWRDPVTQEVRRYKMMGLPRVGGAGSLHVQISIQLMRLPGEVWFAEYVPPGTVRLPVWVADYGGSVFGVNGVKGVVGDLAAVSGTFDVWEKRTDGTQSFTSRAYSGDIPTTAPSGVDWLAGFAA